MPRYLIKNETIVATFAAEQPAREAQLIACGAELVEDDGVYTSQTHTYTGGQFVAIPEPTEAEALAAAQAEAVALARDLMQLTTEANPSYSKYCEAERLTWEPQATEAVAVLADSGASTPTLDAIVALDTSRTKAELADEIVANRTAFLAALGYLTGQRLTRKAAIEAMATVEDVEAYMEQMRAETAAAIAAMAA